MRSFSQSWLNVVNFYRLPSSTVRKAEHNGLNKKSGNLNSALREIWPHHLPVSDRDVMVV